MKKYSVSVFTPTTARLIVDAVGKEEAISKARSLLELGEQPKYELDPEDLGIANFYAEPIKSNRAESADLKTYAVRLTAKSVKGIRIAASSPEDAAAIAKKMYWNTDVLDFTDDDIMMIDADVLPEPVPTVDEFARGRLDFATEIVRMIRESDEPNEVIARLVDSSLLYYIDHPDEPIQGAECVD